MLEYPRLYIPHNISLREMDLSDEGDLLIFLLVLLVCIAVAVGWCVYRQVMCCCCCCRCLAKKTYNLVGT